METIKNNLIVVYLPLITVTFGGIAWLTEMRELALRNQKKIEDLQAEFRANKIRVYDKITKQEERLSRIEGKLDMVIHMIKKDRAHD